MRFKPKGALLTLLLCVVPTLAYANKTTPIKELIQSKVLNEQRTVFVQLPDSYDEKTQQRYPVLYRLDGKGHIPLESAMLNGLYETGSAPEVIIVAIENTDRTRDLAPTVNQDPRGPVGQGGGGDNFLDFIEKELIPHIDKQYRTHDFKLISGGSIGGLLVLHSLQSRPHLFQAHIAYSPAVWWGDYSTAKNLKQFTSGRDKLDNYLYMNIGTEPLELREIYNDLHEHLQKHLPEGFKLTTDAFNDVPHDLTSDAGIFNAYHRLFLPLLMPEKALTYGVGSIKDYYEKVSRQRGGKVVPSEWALRRLGYNQVGKKDFDTAVSVMKYNIKLHPKMAEAYDGLAYAYQRNKQFQLALEQINIALELTPKGQKGHDFYLTRQHKLMEELAK